MGLKELVSAVGACQSCVCSHVQCAVVLRTDRVGIAQTEHGWHEREHEPQQVVRVALRLRRLSVQGESARVSGVSYLRSCAIGYSL